MSKNLLLFIVLVIATVALCSPPRERRMNYTKRYERYNETRMENQTERRWRNDHESYRHKRRHPFIFAIAAIVAILAVICIIRKALKKIKENLYKEVKAMLMADFEKQNNVNTYQSFMANPQMIQNSPIQYKPTVVPQDLTKSTFDRVQYLFV